MAAQESSCAARHVRGDLARSARTLEAQLLPHMVHALPHGHQLVGGKVGVGTIDLAADVGGAQQLGEAVAHPARTRFEEQVSKARMALGLRDQEAVDLMDVGTREQAEQRAAKTVEARFER